MTGSNLFSPRANDCVRVSESDRRLHLMTTSAPFRSAMSACSRKALVSVVIVSWNARSYLERCLDSLAVHGGQRPLEIIVVDNDSSDGSPELVVERYPHVRLIRSGSNLGFAKANNIGLAASSGDFLLLINSDAEVLPGCIDMLILHLESDASLGMAGPRILGGDGLLQRSCRSFPTLWNMTCRALGLDTALGQFKVFSGYSMRYWSQTETRHVDILTGCFWAAKRQAYEDVGGLDEAFFIYGEDMDWCKRFWAKGWKTELLCPPRKPFTTAAAVRETRPSGSSSKSRRPISNIGASTTVRRRRSPTS